MADGSAIGASNGGANVPVAAGAVQPTAVATGASNPNWRDEVNEVARRKLLAKIVGVLREVTDSSESAKQIASQLEASYYRSANSYAEYFNSIAARIYNLKKSLQQKQQTPQQQQAAQQAQVQSQAQQVTQQPQQPQQVQQAQQQQAAVQQQLQQQALQQKLVAQAQQQSLQAQQQAAQQLQQQQGMPMQLPLQVAKLQATNAAAGRQLLRQPMLGMGQPFASNPGAATTPTNPSAVMGKQAQLQAAAAAAAAQAQGLALPQQQAAQAAQQAPGAPRAVPAHSAALKLPPSVPTLGPGPMPQPSMPKVPSVPSGVHVPGQAVNASQLLNNAQQPQAQQLQPQPHQLQAQRAAALTAIQPGQAALYAAPGAPAQPQQPQQAVAAPTDATQQGFSVGGQQTTAPGVNTTPAATQYLEKLQSMQQLYVRPLTSMIKQLETILEQNTQKEATGATPANIENMRRICTTMLAIRKLLSTPPQMNTQHNASNLDMLEAAEKQIKHWMTKSHGGGASAPKDPSTANAQPVATAAAPAGQQMAPPSGAINATPATATATAPSSTAATPATSAPTNAPQHATMTAAAAPSGMTATAPAASTTPTATGVGGIAKPLVDATKVPTFVGQSTLINDPRAKQLAQAAQKSPNTFQRFVAAVKDLDTDSTVIVAKCLSDLLEQISTGQQATTKGMDTSSESDTTNNETYPFWFDEKYMLTKVKDEADVDAVRDAKRRKLDAEVVVLDNHTKKAKTTKGRRKVKKEQVKEEEEDEEEEQQKKAVKKEKVGKSDSLDMRDMDEEEEEEEDGDEEDDDAIIQVTSVRWDSSADATQSKQGVKRKR